MFFSGIADEASPQLSRQIEAHVALGWRHIEMRNIEGVSFTDLPDETFASAAARLEEAGLKVSCFASQIGNWARPISSDFERDAAELTRAGRRMARLGTRFIRCMSYPNATPPWSDGDWREEAVRRMKLLARMAEDAGVVLVHENCSGWGGQGPGQTMELLDAVGSDHLKLVFDTGNPIEYHQDSWTYYRQVRQHVVYVHIKDYQVSPDGKHRAVFPGEGKGAVREIIADLFSRGYDGGFSIEPHITSVIHKREEASDPELAYRTYVEYGRRLEALVREIHLGSSPRAEPAH